jgi:branched-chain amino acid transport system substrate-binding protein
MRRSRLASSDSADAEGARLEDFLRWMEETGSGPSEQAMFGWLNADLAYEGLVAAGDDLSRGNVIAATDEMTERSAGGLINPIDWTRQHEPPTDRAWSDPEPAALQ